MVIAVNVCFVHASRFVPNAELSRARRRLGDNHNAGSGAGFSAWCTPGMGVNLWGESPLYVNPASVLCTFAQVLAEGKGGTARDRLEEAGAQSDEPSLPRTRSGEQKQHTRPSLRVS